MYKTRRWRHVLWIEIIGFLLIIIVSWLDEVADLPATLFGGALPGAGWRESALETLVILAVAVPTVWATSRITRRLYRLEGFLRLCSWCKRIETDDHWMPVAEYIEKQLKIPTSHGICPACAEKEFRQEAS